MKQGKQGPICRQLTTPFCLLNDTDLCSIISHLQVAYHSCKVLSQRALAGPK